MELIHVKQLNLYHHQSSPAWPHGHAYEKRITESYEFDYILSSDHGQIVTGSSVTDLQPGMFFVRTPGMTVQGFSHYSSWYLTFRTENCIAFPQYIYHLRPELCNPVFKKLYDLHIQRPSDYEYLIDYYMNSLLFLLYEEERHIQTLQKKEHSLDLVYEEMKNSWNRNLPLDYYVSLSGYSKSRFCHLFQELYQISPIQFLHHLRLQNLCYQLIETTIPVKELMIEHGYVNEQSFFRTFKAYTGETPAAYRRKHQLK